MVGLTLLHLSLLHVDGSTNPLAIDGLYDFIPFYPYFLVKDIFGFLIFLFVFSYLVFFEPNLLGHPDNYIRANPLVTPPHIVPEWYFLPFYAILRAVPSKLGGVIAMGASIGILFLMPALDRGNCYLVRGILSVGEVFYFVLKIILITPVFVFSVYALYWATYGHPDEEIPSLKTEIQRWLDIIRWKNRFLFIGYRQSSFTIQPRIYTKGRFAPIFKIFFSF
jgi:quinol-cytochrome oxidoreductase complex cytochrome b subunit